MNDINGILERAEERNKQLARLIEKMLDKHEQTNEEWFCGLSTEEKADLMSRMVGCSNCPIPKDGRSCMGTYSGCWNEIIKWLKQPHK